MISHETINLQSARRRRLMLVLLLMLATFVVFSRAIGGGFVSWDDEPLIYANPNIVTPTGHSLWNHWAAPHAHLYIPLIYTAWWCIAWLEQARSGLPGQLSPMGFHLANVLVHCVSVGIVFAILRRLIKRDWPAAIGAMVFAVHPLQVEPVAWATGMKDVLGGMLTLAAVWMYVAAAQRPSRWRWIIATIFFIAALLAKPSAVVTPLNAGVLDVLLIRRNWRLAIAWLWQWMILSVVWIGITMHVQPASDVDAGPLWARPMIAGNALTFYLAKFLLPVNLAIDYGRTPTSVLAGRAIYFIWLIPAALAIIVWRLRCAELTAAASLFVLALLPVLGLFRFEFQMISTVADRYAYVALLGPALAFAYLTSIPIAPLARKTLAIAIGALLLLWAAMSWTQIAVWHDSESLYRHALEANPHSLTATEDLAVAYDKSGKTDDAISLYLRVIALSPEWPEAYDNLAEVLPRAEREMPQEAPRWASLHQMLSRYYSSQGRQEDARKQSDDAARLDRGN